MDEKGLKELLLQRLHMELLFKDTMLQKGKEDIFRPSYEIEVMVNLYEILAAYTESLQSDMLRGLLNLNFGYVPGMAGERGQLFWGIKRVCM